MRKKSIPAPGDADLSSPSARLTCHGSPLWVRRINIDLGKQRYSDDILLFGCQYSPHPLKLAIENNLSFTRQKCDPKQAACKGQLARCLLVDRPHRRQFLLPSSRRRPAAACLWAWTDFFWWRKGNIEAVLIFIRTCRQVLSLSSLWRSSQWTTWSWFLDGASFFFERSIATSVFVLRLSRLAILVGNVHLFLSL